MMAKSASKELESPAQTASTADSGGTGVPPQTYEAALAELDELVARMEGGSLSLEESLAAYRRGAVLVKFCQQQLEKVEQQVRVLDGETLRPVPLNTPGGAAQGGDDDL
jgi:exodeoxyribonuclease VII small subunit